MRRAVAAFGIVMLVLGAVLFGGSAVIAPGIVAGSGGQPATVGNLVGYVTNQSNGAGIVGATIQLYVSGTLKYATSTTTAGYYKFGGITGGGYVINITAPKYQGFQGYTGVTPGTTTTFDAQLSPIGSGGTSGGSSCQPLPTGGGCTTPPPNPPPGVPGPLPISNTTTATNATQQAKNLNSTTGNLKTIGVVLIAIGAVALVVAGLMPLVIFTAPYVHPDYGVRKRR